MNPSTFGMGVVVGYGLSILIILSGLIYMLSKLFPSKTLSILWQRLLLDMFAILFFLFFAVVYVEFSEWVIQQAFIIFQFGFSPLQRSGVSVSTGGQFGTSVLTSSLGIVQNLILKTYSGTRWVFYLTNLAYTAFGGVLEMVRIGGVDTAIGTVLGKLPYLSVLLNLVLKMGWFLISLSYFYYFLYAWGYKLIYVLFPTGLFLRLFPPTRGTGALLMALSLAIYPGFALSLMISFFLFYSPFDVTFPGGECLPVIQQKALIEKFVGEVAGVKIVPTTFRFGLGWDVITAFSRHLYAIFLSRILILFFAFVLSYNIFLFLNGVFYADIPEVGRGIAKLV